MKGLAWGVIYATLLVILSVTNNVAWFVSIAAFFEKHGNMSSSLATFFGPVMAAAIAVIAANRQVEAWRAEARAKRRAEIAEELVSLAFEVEDAFRAIRHPSMSLVGVNKENSLVYFERKLSRMGTYDELFLRFRRAQIRVKAIIGNAVVDEAVNTIHASRNRLVIALSALLAESKMSSPNNDSKFSDEWRSMASSNQNNDDETSVELSSCVKTIYAELNSIVQLKDGNQ
ncbi:hypothetical protein H9N28_15340 [Rhodobacter capsulatus]|uniref:hypothetical protein n=1 Tax=Rhodobacter capsulatus TaxID=1061 RepID=UPI0011BCF800|nr:hypothetical protein [Rhodobacter capsulatus]QNR62900.1 hypothetical protein H9N28_15340 [Rhodobacter capsulatus]